MKAIGTTVQWFLGAVLPVVLVASVMAGETDSAEVTPYEGQIRSIQIDKCGPEPGSCEGSIMLAQAGGAATSADRRSNQADAPPHRHVG